MKMKNIHSFMKSLKAMLLRIIKFLDAVIYWIVKVVDVILLAFFKVGVTIMHQLAKVIKGTPSIVFSLVGAILPFVILYLLLAWILGDWNIIYPYRRSTMLVLLIVICVNLFLSYLILKGNRKYKLLMIVCISNLIILSWFFVSIIYETKDIFSIGESDKILVSLCFEYVMALLGFVGYKGINEEYANS